MTYTTAPDYTYPASLGVGGHFIYTQVQLVNGSFAVPTVGSVPEIHYPIQFDTVLKDDSGLWNPTLKARNPPPPSGFTNYTVANGGTGYTVNDILTVSGGTPTTAAQYKVSSVNAGVVTGVTLQTAGSYNPRTTPTNPVSTTGGTGTGCTLYVLWDGCYVLVPAGYNFAEAICSAIWQANATGRRQVGVEVNYAAPTIAARNTVTVNSGTDTTVHATQNLIIPVNPGDKIVGIALQTSGGNLNVVAGGSTCFQVKLYKSLPSP